jgi:hypothetical protein
MSLPRLTLLLFLTFQIADGIITYAATSVFGTLAEGNPILVTWMHVVGIGPTLLGAKLLACAGGYLLYTRRVNVGLAALTLWYAIAAVIPWLRELSSIGSVRL